MSFVPFLNGTIPNIGDIPDFNPAAEQLIAPGQANATTEITQHWLFTNAIPEWLSYLLSFSAAAAVLMMVVGGAMMAISSLNDDYFAKGRKIIIFSLAGLIISILTYSIVSIADRLPFSGSSVNTDIQISDDDGVIENLVQGDLRTELIPQLIKLILGISALTIFVLMLYAGALMVMRDGEDEMVQKGKKILIYTSIGMVVIVVSYAVVEAVLQLNFERQ